MSTKLWVEESNNRFVTYTEYGITIKPKKKATLNTKRKLLLSFAAPLNQTPGRFPHYLSKACVENIFFTKINTMNVKSNTNYFLVILHK